jgi:hypothetical protein
MRTWRWFTLDRLVEHLACVAGTYSIVWLPVSYFDRSLIFRPLHEPTRQLRLEKCEVVDSMALHHTIPRVGRRRPPFIAGVLIHGVMCCFKSTRQLVCRLDRDDLMVRIRVQRAITWGKYLYRSESIVALGDYSPLVLHLETTHH